MHRGEESLELVVGSAERVERIGSLDPGVMRNLVVSDQVDVGGRLLDGLERGDALQCPAWMHQRMAPGQPGSTTRLSGERQVSLHQA